MPEAVTRPGRGIALPCHPKPGGGCPKTAAITQNALTIVQKTPLTDDEIENGTWEENKERQAALGECDTLYFERPENIEESLFAFIKVNRAKIEP
jgi:hypothetical protein